MTPDDLAAIRARDAATTPYVVREGEYAQCKTAMDDRRVLLAEVDRLTEAADGAWRSLKGAVQKYDAAQQEVDRLTAELEMASDSRDEWRDIAEGWPAAMERKLDAERARIRAAVEGLEVQFTVNDAALVSRAAVIAAIDGEAT